MDYSSCQTIKSLSFGIFTSEEIRKLSVLDITNTEILDKLENPTSEGLHDLRLGPNDEKDELCSTCNKNFFNCPGHPGHITLPVTVYNPVFFPELYKILSGSCLNCHKLVASESQLCLVYYQFQALDYGLVNIVEELAEIIDASEKISKIKRKLQQKFEEAIQGLTIDDKNQTKSVVECQREIRKNIITKMKKVTKCPHCKMLRKKLINKSDTRLVYNENVRAHKSTSVSKNDSQMITSELKNKEISLKDVREHILLLWENDKIVLQNLYKILQKVSIDMFFMDLIMVPPSKFRRVKLSSIKIDMKTLLEEEVSTAFVHSVKNIKQALLVKNLDARNGCNMMIKTNGVNFLDIFQYGDILDVNKAYSNDIHAIRTVFGIEAAARAIKKEITNVFRPYGINVDDHHLSLISDYMTSSGFYRPCNRKGLEGSPSPLQAMTFETSKNFLVDAMLTGVEDKLKNPSANIIVGQLHGAGTGSFDLFTPRLNDALDF